VTVNVIGNVLGGGGGGGSADGEIVSISEVSTRWIAVIAVTTCDPDNLYIFYRAGNNKFTVYDPTDTFSEFFDDRSSIVANGDATWTVTLLPNGGWWQKNFEIKYVAGIEMELAV